MNSKNKSFIKMLPIKTDRLIIRKTNIDDVDMLLKMDKQEYTQKFLGGIKNITREERIELLKKKISKFNDDLAGSLTACLVDGTPIGFIGLKIDEDNNKAELSYIFDYDYCNKGYCTEASKKLIDIGFNDLELKSIFAETVKGNNSSIRVLEKLGFKYEYSDVKDSNNFLYYYIYNEKYDTLLL